jgi:hypothetical protein
MVAEGAANVPNVRRISRANLGSAATLRDGSRLEPPRRAPRRQHEHGGDAQRTGMPETDARRECRQVLTVSNEHLHRATARPRIQVRSGFTELLIPPQAVWRRRAVQQMVTQPLQDRYREAGRSAQEGNGQSFRRGRLRWHLRQSPDALAVLSPFGMRGIGQEDADTFDDNVPPWHAFVMAAVQEGGGNQARFERVVDTCVMAQVQQPVDVVLHVPAVLSEEAVAEVFEGLAASSRPRSFAIQKMILELQQADRAVACSEGRDSLLVE